MSERVVEVRHPDGVVGVLPDANNTIWKCSPAAPMKHVLLIHGFQKVLESRHAPAMRAAGMADGEALRAPLMLQKVLGVDAACIASAFLASPATNE